MQDSFKRSIELLLSEQFTFFEKIVDECEKVESKCNSNDDYFNKSVKTHTKNGFIIRMPHSNF